MQNASGMVLHTSLTNIATKTSLLWLPRAGSPCRSGHPFISLFISPTLTFPPFINLLLQSSPDPEDFINSLPLSVFSSKSLPNYSWAWINLLIISHSKLRESSSKRDTQISCPHIPRILVRVMDRKP